jgi:16S rRNA (uracil1498-N3)-methyltransferase
VFKNGLFRVPNYAFSNKDVACCVPLPPIEAFEQVLLFYHTETAPAGGQLWLPEEESRHCLKVLRMGRGDELFLTDGRGQLTQARIADTQGKQCVLEVLQVSRPNAERSFAVHIAVSPLKNADRIEWFVEKAVEIGIEEISFIRTRHTERDFFNMERMEKKAIAAMKQSLKTTLPRLHAPTDFGRWIEQVSFDEGFICHVDSANPQTLAQSVTVGKRVCVLIGPEGDFDAAEVALAQAKGFRKVSLGKSRLRTETAALVACHTINLVNEG